LIYFWLPDAGTPEGQLSFFLSEEPVTQLIRNIGMIHSNKIHFFIFSSIALVLGCYLRLPALDDSNRFKLHFFLTFLAANPAASLSSGGGFKDEGISFV
jgi:hypothetical protein